MKEQDATTQTLAEELATTMNSAVSGSIMI